jgi:peroxiredoxin family protein
MAADLSSVIDEAELEQRVQRMVDTYLEQRLAEEKRQRTKKVAIIVTKGTLDWAYPPLIIATTAAAMGMEVGMFFTFYGLNIIHRHRGKKLKVAPLGNPAMPMPVPNVVGAIPGMTHLGTRVMKRMFKAKGVAGIDELLEMALETGVKMWPCGMTAEVFGYNPEELIEGVEPACGAASFVRYASDAEISLFI